MRLGFRDAGLGMRFGCLRSEGQGSRMEGCWFSAVIGFMMQMTPMTVTSLS